MRYGALRTSSIIAGIIYAYGAVLCVVGLVYLLLTDRALPSYRWWQFVLLPFAIGIVAVALEAVGTYLGNGFKVRPGASGLRLAAGKVALVLVLVALLVGLPIYQLSRQ